MHLLRRFEAISSLPVFFKRRYRQDTVSGSGPVPGRRSPGTGSHPDAGSSGFSAPESPISSGHYSQLPARVQALCNLVRVSGNVPVPCLFFLCWCVEPDRTKCFSQGFRCDRSGDRGGFFSVAGMRSADRREKPGMSGIREIPVKPGMTGRIRKYPEKPWKNRECWEESGKLSGFPDRFPTPNEYAGRPSGGETDTR